MSTEQGWFYEQGGNQQGPVSASAIQGMISSGTIPRNTLVWREGLADWTHFDKSELCGNQNFPTVAPPAGPRAYTPRPARLKSNFNFSVFNSLSVGWKVMVENFWPFVGFYVLASLIYGVASNLVIPMFIGFFPIMGGYMYYTLLRLRGHPGDVENIFDGFKRRLGSTAMLSFLMILPLLLAMIPLFGSVIYLSQNPEFVENSPVAFGAILTGGILFTIFVTIVMTTVTGLATLLCLDCDIGWSQAFGLGLKAFTKHAFKFFGFAIIVTILSYGGLILLFVGTFVAGAWSIGAFSHIYEEAFGD